MTLPKEFCERMEQMLTAEYEAFLASYDNPNYQSLRINPLKTDIETFLKQCPFSLEKVPWAEYGYYYAPEDKPGKSAYHDAGVYYIQEPSAMAAAEYLDAKAGERILDLCAAPGGKSTQIAAKMNGEGILVCNEIHPARAKILSENVERMGICNAVVTNETPERLSEHFMEYFDKILVDAPCSGEGMFRKNEEACEEWSVDNVQQCAARQDKILDCAAHMLKPGGTLLYSTCTFAPAENEGSISRFLQRHEGFAIVSAEKKDNMKGGVSKWIDNPVFGIEQTIRLWPHHVKGEGHYIAVLKKEGSLSKSYQGFCRGGEQKAIANIEKECAEFFSFAKQTLKQIPKGKFLWFGDQLYFIPNEMPSIEKLKVLRAGLHVGTLKKNRFEPSHALALAQKPEDVYNICPLESESFELKAYLNGQTFPFAGEKGWYLITVDGYSIGWGKCAGGIMKNHYPKGLRKNFS